MPRDEKGDAPKFSSSSVQGKEETSSPADTGLVRFFFTWIIPLIPLAKLFSKLSKIAVALVIILIIIGGLWIGISYAGTKTQTGEVASAVVHGQVAGEKALSGPAKIVKSISPDLCAALFPSECAYNPFAIDSVVDRNENNRDIGVEIKEFKSLNDFFS